MKNIPPIILASKSPRRIELLRLMNLPFEQISKEVDESYPDHFSHSEIVLHISENKAKAFDGDAGDKIVLTADTLVSLGDQILGKPADEQHAKQMLAQLSGQMHRVYTGVTLFYRGNFRSFVETSEVYFRELSAVQISYYVENYKPLDKAGAYGVQEWIGLIGIEKIVGSYTNIVGLPTEKLYQALLNIS